MNLSQRKKFIGYFDMRLESLDDCYITFKKTIDDEKKTIKDSVYNGCIKSTDPELNKTFFKLDCHILSTFRNCMIVAACTLIEDVLLQIGVYTVPDFEKRVKKVKKVEKEEEGLSKIRKYLQVLESQLSIREAWGSDLKL